MSSRPANSAFAGTWTCDSADRWMNPTSCSESAPTDRDCARRATSTSAEVDQRPGRRARLRRHHRPRCHTVGAHTATPGHRRLPRRHDDGDDDRADPEDLRRRRRLTERHGTDHRSGHGSNASSSAKRARPTREHHLIEHIGHRAREHADHRAPREYGSRRRRHTRDRTHTHDDRRGHDRRDGQTDTRSSMPRRPRPCTPTCAAETRAPSTMYPPHNTTHPLPTGADGHRAIERSDTRTTPTTTVVSDAAPRRPRVPRARR